MKFKQLLCLLVLSTPLTVNADFLSLSAGGGLWNTSTSGSFKKTSDPANVDVNNDLLWQSETQNYAFVSFEHFVPLVPNVRLMLTNIDQSGNGGENFTFDGIIYDDNVQNDFSIQTLDLLFYYEMLDNIVSLDIGLNIRNLKVDYTITGNVSGTATTTADSLDETVPMLYVLVGGSPWPDLIISGELSYIAFSGSSISDFTAKIAYTTEFFVGFEVGYRKQKYVFDDISNTDASLNFDGVFAGAYLKF